MRSNKPTFFKRRSTAEYSSGNTMNHFVLELRIKKAQTAAMHYFKKKEMQM